MCMFGVENLMKTDKKQQQQKTVHLNEELKHKKNEMWFVENNIGGIAFSDAQSNQKLKFSLIYPFYQVKNR